MTEGLTLTWNYAKSLVLQKWLGILLGILGLLEVAEWLLNVAIPFPHWLRIAIAAVSFLVVAPYLAYKEKAQEALELERQLHSRKSKLLIHPGHGSRCVVQVSEGDHTYTLGTYVEFELAIENKGNRNSSVNNFAFTVKETSKEYADLKPVVRDSVRGWGCVYSLDRRLALAPQGIIQIQAEQMTNPGLLAFFCQGCGSSGRSAYSLHFVAN